ncbi:MAG: MFS transporter [Rhodospirillales bacterium]|nr:MFS transporter [Rhodospirillales bacterium]
MAGGWGELLRGGNAQRSAVVGGGMVIHAISTFIVTTILPTVVHDIGGLRFFAWSTTLYVVASLLGGAGCARLMARVGARGSYRAALGIFALGAAVCALAPNMPALLIGRFIQGLGAGTLSALSFTMVRTLFAETLWARAISVVSAAWGVATLAGPAVGGVFAQYHAWRLAFWMVFAAAPLLLALVERALPRDLARPPAPRGRMAWLNLGVLAASALCVSAGSSSPQVVWNVVGLAAAVGGFALFIRLEQGARKLLPTGACNPTVALGAAYAAMLTLIIGITTEIFVPYFLQTLHGLVPLHAGYLSALMSGGWTTGSVGGASLGPRGARTAMRSGPLAMALGLAGLFVLMPAPSAPIWPIGLCLAAMGLGIGLCWPHLGASVFASAPERERDLAASSMTMVIMVSNALGSALGGMVTNVAGLSVPGGAAGATSAATWLFGAYVVSPLLAGLAVHRLLAAWAA